MTLSRFSEQAEQRYATLLERFARNDREHRWSRVECRVVGEGFVDISERHRKFTKVSLATALYNAGLAFQRCGEHDRAKARFTEAVQSARDFHQGHTALALYEYRATADLDAATARLDHIVKASKYQDIHALVTLAAFQLELAKRGGDAMAELSASKNNLQRALAIDDGYLPALNQLALYYLELARHHAGQLGGDDRLSTDSTEPVQPSRRQLDLANLVVGRAMKRDDSYAPLYNTAGLIQVEAKNFTEASRAFARAREIDPRFFEAHMNYAAVNLMFRGFSAAEGAYREALKLDPDSYEAHLGLSLSLRGQLTNANRARLGPEIERELASASRVAPGRPEVDYNRALFREEQARDAAADDVQALAELERAEQSLIAFLKKAGDDPAYAESVKKAKERLRDVRDTMTWLQRGLQLKKGKPAEPRASRD